MKSIEIIYSDIEKRVVSRLEEFKSNWIRGDNRDAFRELSFCLFTPQSSAKKCWDAIVELESTGLLFSGSAEEIREHMSGVRFKIKKSIYLVEAREKFLNNFDLKSKIESFEDSYQRREWLVENVKGFGYKEAGHYLRNIGFGENLAILDRHILKNLVKERVIEIIPKSMSKKIYLDIESKMQKFAQRVDIDIQHLDLLFWYMEAGHIFK